jgi:hypothetical protein
MEFLDLGTFVIPPEALTKFGIKLDPSDLNPEFALANFICGGIYVGVGFLVAVIGRCL